MSAVVDSKPCIGAGLLTTLVPAGLAYLGAERLTLLTLIVIGPFALGLWLRAAHSDLQPWRAVGTVLATLVVSNGVVFAEYRLLDAAGFTAPTPWLGLGAAGLAGLAVAFVGDRVGGWVIKRRQAGSRGFGGRLPYSERSDTASVGGFCGECPACGACHAPGTLRCDRDGVTLFPLNVPHVLAGRYELQHRLGRGGMSTVYAGFDRTLDRRVAVKLVRDDLEADGPASGTRGCEGSAERFQSEARAAASFNHPNVVTVFDYGVTGSQAFLVMELLAGKTLREVLRAEARLAPNRVLAIVRDVVAAIEAAHARTLVHRDLKPENIWLVGDGARERAKVLDFGLAGFVTTDNRDPLAPWAGGQLAGTPLYMAPEQLRGEAPQPTWDLWALAVMTFEMACGAHPFAGLLLPASEVGDSQSDLPAGLRTFFDGALAIETSRRPESAAQFMRELEEHLHA